MSVGRHSMGFAVVLALMSSTALARADVTDDCIAANDRSIALRRAGKLLDARAEVAKCAVEACGQDLQSSCLKRSDEITAAVPSIVFDVKDETGADVVGARIALDGRRVDNAATVAASLDPGEHTVVIEAPGRRVFEKTVVLREGERQRRELVVLALLHDASATTVRPPPPASPPAATRRDDASPSSTQRILGLSLGAGGVVGLVLGTVFGLSASSKWDDAKSACGDGCASGDAADAKKSDAESAATVSTVSFVAGGALVAGGAALFFTAPSSTASSSARSGILRLSARVGGLSLGGTF